MHAFSGSARLPGPVNPIRAPSGAASGIPVKARQRPVNARQGPEKPVKTPGKTPVKTPCPNPENSVPYRRAAPGFWV